MNIPAMPTTTAKTAGIAHLATRFGVNRFAFDALDPGFVRAVWCGDT
jgi:hypothetical protein